MITDAEFAEILADESKLIEDGVWWWADPGHLPAERFIVVVASDSDRELRLQGWFNRRSETLSFALFCPGADRIYGLCMGVTHGRQDPTGFYVKHKHRWSVARKDRNLYWPYDITAPWHDVATVWRQFCEESRITHHGQFNVPESDGE